MSAPVSVAEGLFRDTIDGIALVGSRCSGCGTCYFPTASSCRNPACSVKTVEEALFGRQGRLASFTVQRYQPPALFRVESWKPYVIGLVDLPEGLQVLAMVTGCAADELRVDLPVRLTTERLHTDEAGSDVVTYAYTPAGEDAA